MLIRYSYCQKHLHISSLLCCLISMIVLGSIQRLCLQCSTHEKISKSMHKHDRSVIFIAPFFLFVIAGCLARRLGRFLNFVSLPLFLPSSLPLLLPFSVWSQIVGHNWLQLQYRYASRRLACRWNWGLGASLRR